MRLCRLALATLILCSAPSFGEKLGTQGGTSAAPQTARQALLEMFFSKSSGTFMKHLPAATRAALEQSGALSALNQYALLGGQLEAQQKNLQTFETGSLLLASEDPKLATKVEVIVDNDALRGDEDDIELSFQTYKNGLAQRTPFMPRMTFSMKMESDIWKLNEIGVAVRLPLADPDLLKSISEAMKAQSVRSTSSSSPARDTMTQTAGSEASVVSAMRTILTAETTYATTYQAVGYTCTLSDLDGFGSSERNEHQAMLINSGLAGGKRLRYVFTLSQCAGTPASSFQLTAAPGGNSFGRRAYCADQTGGIRYSAHGNLVTCINSGVPLE